MIQEVMRYEDDLTTGHAQTRNQETNHFNT